MALYIHPNPLKVEYQKRGALRQTTEVATASSSLNNECSMPVSEACVGARGKSLYPPLNFITNPTLL